MATEEVCLQYRLAKDKKKQIKILAELNATTKQKIVEILTQGGVAVPEQKPQTPQVAKPKQPRVFKFDETLARQLYDQGLMDKEIGRLVGASQPTICEWRKQHSLPSHYPKPSKTTKGPASTMKKLVEDHVDPLENMVAPPSIPQGALSNPVLVKIQAIMDMMSPEDSDRVSGQYLDLMVSMLSDEIQRIVKAK